VAQRNLDDRSYEVHDGVIASARSLYFWLLRMMIDESGVPRDLQVVRGLGLGLDQKAIEAVQQWRFKPGTTRCGQPVPVTANMEINFRL